MNKKSVIIKIEVDSCKDCPFMETKRTMGAGDACDWFCKKENKKIAGYIEWKSEEIDIIVPEWCPYRHH